MNWNWHRVLLQQAISVNIVFLNVARIHIHWFSMLQVNKKLLKNREHPVDTCIPGILNAPTLYAHPWVSERGGREGQGPFWILKF